MGCRYDGREKSQSNRTGGRTGKEKETEEEK